MFGRSSAVLYHSLIKNTATPKSGCYTLGLETDEVAEANAEDTGSDKVALSSDKMAIKC